MTCSRDLVNHPPTAPRLCGRPVNPKTTPNTFGWCDDCLHLVPLPWPKIIVMEK